MEKYRFPGRVDIIPSFALGNYLEGDKNREIYWSSAIERIANIVSGGKIRNNESGMNTKVSVHGCQFSCIDVSVKGAIGAVDRRNE